MTAEFTPDDIPINAEAARHVNGKAELFIGGPKDGERLTILYGKTAQVIVAPAPQPVSSLPADYALGCVEFHNYRVEILGVAGAPVARVWVSETLGLREAIEAMAANYASAAVRARVASVAREAAQQLLPVCADNSSARAAYVALRDLIEDFEP